MVQISDLLLTEITDCEIVESPRTLLYSIDALVDQIDISFETGHVITIELEPEMVRVIGRIPGEPDPYHLNLSRLAPVPTREDYLTEALSLLGELRDEAPLTPSQDHRVEEWLNRASRSV